MRRSRIGLGILALLGLALPALGADVTWTGGVGFNWSSTGNWTSNLLPNSARTAVFDDSSPDGCVVNVAYQSVGDIRFTKSTGYVIGGPGPLNASGTVDVATTGTCQFNVSYVAYSRTNWVVPGGSSLVFNGGVDFYYDGTWVKPLQGVVPLTFSGTGTVTIAAMLSAQTRLDYMSMSGGTLRNTTTQAPRMLGLSGDGVLEMNGGIFQMENRGDCTFSGTITGTARMTKGGGADEGMVSFGTFTLAGRGNLASTGTLTIALGTVALDYSAPGAYSTNKIPDATPVSFNNGAYYGVQALKVIGSPEGDVVEQVGKFYMTGACATIEVNRGTDHNATLAFTNTTSSSMGNASDGSAVQCRFKGLDLAGTGANYSRILFGSTGILSNGIIGGSGRYTCGNDFATYDATNGVMPLSPDARPGVNSATATGNALMTSDTALKAAGNTINTLRIDGAYGLDLSGTKLTLNGSGIIQTGTNNTAGISNGTLSVPSGAHLFIDTETDLVISATISILGSNGYLCKNGPGKLTITSIATSLGGKNGIAWGEGTLDWESDANVTLMPNAVGPSSLIKGGNGTMTAYSTSPSRVCANYTGGTFIKAGTLANMYFYGTGAFQVDSGAAFSFNADFTYNNVDFKGGGLLYFNSAAGSLLANRKTLTGAGCSFAPGTLSAAGTLSEEGNLTLAKYGAGLSSIQIDVFGGATPTADCLAVTGTVLNLGNANLAINVAAGTNLLGQTLTVLTCGNDLTATGTVKRFNSLALSGDPLLRSATLAYGAGFVSVTGFQYHSILSAAPAGGNLIAIGTNTAVNTAVLLDSYLALSNTGGPGSMLNITDPVVSGTNASLFSAVLHSGGTTSLSQGAIALYDLAFAGTDTAGIYTATLMFTTDATSGPQTAAYDLVATVVAATDIPGDINRDHIVDQADYTVWYNHYGQTPATWADGDVTGDNIVDQADYTVWYNHYGATGGNVPEPMTMALLAIGGLAMLRRRT